MLKRGWGGTQVENFAGLGDSARPTRDLPTLNRHQLQGRVLRVVRRNVNNQPVE